MAKQTSEGSNRLTIFWLKKHGYLNGSSQYGGIKWTYGMSEDGSSINFIITTDNSENPNIRLKYIYTSSWTGEKNNMDYQVELTTTSCRYGGKRYWFTCLLSKNGKYCGRRVGVLFSIGKWFGCRHCGEIAYYSQMQGGNNKGFVSIRDIERAEEEVKRYFYKGKPTRKYRRVIRLNEKFESGFIKIATSLNKHFGNPKK